MTIPVVRGRFVMRDSIASDGESRWEDEEKEHVLISRTMTKQHVQHLVILVPLLQFIRVPHEGASGCSFQGCSDCDFGRRTEFELLVFYSQK